MIKIITDSTSDLLPEIVARYDIQVVPLQLLFGHETLRDGIDITNKEFFQRLRTSDTIATTSQPSVGTFCEVFQRNLEQGHEILGIFISGVLSGTYASAEAAKEQFPDAPITLIDSLSATIGLGYMVMTAARAAETGATRDEIAQKVLAMREKVHLYFVVETLEYLRRGGRIGGAQALMGTLLNIKPILTLQAGRVEPVERVRTKRKAVERMVEIALQQVEQSPEFLGVLHGDAEGEAQILTEQLQSRTHAQEFYSSIVTPVLGAHTGPGVVGVVVYANGKV